MLRCLAQGCAVSQYRGHVNGMFSLGLVMQDLMWCVMSIRCVAQAQMQVLLKARATAVPLSSRYACLDPYADTTLSRLSLISIVCMWMINSSCI